MTQRNNSVSGDALISQQAADEAVYRALSLFIGQGRRYSCDDIETGTGIAARTVGAWIANAIENRRRPKGSHLLILQQFIGLELTNKLLGPIGQGGRPLQPDENEPSVVIAKLAAGVAEFAARGADGRFCHIDRAELEDDADMIIATVVPFSSRGAK
jgi:hypothetical protein